MAKRKRTDAGQDGQPPVRRVADNIRETEIKTLALIDCLEAMRADVYNGRVFVLRLEEGRISRARFLEASGIEEDRLRELLRLGLSVAQRNAKFDVFAAVEWLDANEHAASFYDSFKFALMAFDYAVKHVWDLQDLLPRTCRVFQFATEEPPAFAGFAEPCWHETVGCIARRMIAAVYRAAGEWDFLYDGRQPGEGLHRETLLKMWRNRLERQGDQTIIHPMPEPTNYDFDVLRREVRREATRALALPDDVFRRLASASSSGTSEEPRLVAAMREQIKKGNVAPSRKALAYSIPRGNTQERYRAANHLIDVTKEFQIAEPLPELGS